jgi:hypothetical protein
MNKEFEVHILNESGIQKARDLAGLFDGLLDKVVELVPAGRELSIVRTKLEEACFFAKKGIANAAENQKETA